MAGPEESLQRPVAAETTELLQALGHEVGNLLAAIRLSAHLIVVGEAGSEASADIEELAARAGVLLTLIRPLLRGGEDERARLDADELVTGLVRALEGRRDRSERLEVVPPGAQLPAVRADPDALHHAFVVLVVGALEASRPGGAVRVAARRQGRELVLSVEDDAGTLLAEPDALLGRSLDLRLVEAVVSRDGGRLRVTGGAEGTRAEIVLPGFPGEGAS
jgi:signal transduction histidine kinase